MLSAPAPTVLIMTAHQTRDDTTAVPARVGTYWDIADYTTLVDGLRDGRLLEDIAADLERTRSAVAGRLAWLIPAEADVARRTLDRELWLREALNTTGDYDWFAVLRTHYTTRGMHLWTAEDDTLLHTAWQQRTPLVELVAQLGLPEMHIVRRCMQVDLADSLPHVTQRLQPIPGGTVDVRARLARDRAAAAVWVLIIDGCGTPILELGHARQHVSLHPHYDAALDTAAELLDAADEDTDTVRYSILERTVGEGTIGSAHHMVLDSEP